MEYTPEKCKRKHRKHVNLFDDLFHVCSQSSSSSNSETNLRHLKIRTSKTRKAKGYVQINKKRDYLTRLIERKKLKEKSLSKKMKTPYDRRLNRSCWPIKLDRVSKIKTKPREKKKKKPTHRSLMQKKFTNPTITSKTECTRESSSVSYSDSDMDDEFLKEVNKYYNHKHFVYEPVTLQMLMDVLHDPEHLKSGATLDMIIAKLRALKLDLNPALDLLREEVIQKLNHGIKLGLVTKNNGYYKVAENSRISALSRKKRLHFGSCCTN